MNNQLTRWNGAALSYDLNGNMTSDGIRSYTWSARNQLTAIGTTTFAYDAVGRRSQNGAGVSFVYDGLNPVQEIVGGSVRANLVTGGLDEYFARTDSGGTSSFITDALGSTLALADSTGTVQTQYTFDPFGNTTSTGASSTNAFQYTGRENDGSSMYYYRARYYNATLQRFISEDPLGLGGGINNYVYAVDNPVFYVDPFGQNVTITAYTGQNVNFFGHVGVSVNGSPTWGFIPAPGWDAFTILGPVPGKVSPVGFGRPIDTQCTSGICQVTIPTTTGQDQAMLDYINRRIQDGGYYHLAGRNCAQFVEDVLNAGGVDSPNTPLPRTLIDLLKNTSGPLPSVLRCPTGVCGLQ